MTLKYCCFLMLIHFLDDTVKIPFVNLLGIPFIGVAEEFASKYTPSIKDDWTFLTYHAQIGIFSWLLNLIPSQILDFTKSRR